MNRRSILAALGVLPALLFTRQTTNAQGDGVFPARPTKWICHYCKGEFEARVIDNKHRAVRFSTVKGEYETCTFAVGREMIKVVNCKLVKEKG